MFLIEYHDEDVDNLKAGTLEGRSELDDYVYQVEANLQDKIAQALLWRRAYLLADGEVWAIWERDPDTKDMRYVAHGDDYPGEWVLPFVRGTNAPIATGVWGKDFSTEEEAADWAINKLSGAVTAIALDGGRIRLAWELVDGSAQLIARGPAMPQ